MCRNKFENHCIRCSFPTNQMQVKILSANQERAKYIYFVVYTVQQAVNLEEAVFYTQHKHFYEHQLDYLNPFFSLSQTSCHTA